MRLINCETLELEEFFGSDVPDYAILSHTWGNEEVTFSDLPLHQTSANTKFGHRKIMHTCQQALRHELCYAWIDTCCIDKTSSAELSEAINSMYVWYRDSTRCYAILEDVVIDRFEDSFKTSRWFTRGWTLQELIAPSGVIFYDQDWVQLGTRRDLAASISNITSIDEMVLYHGIASSGSRHKPPMQAPRLDHFCVAKRMSWASLRKTTREEDIAYCLLGIFELNMPLLYGEGRRAFVRLQEELMRRTDDHSILAWDLNTQFSFSPGRWSYSYSSARFSDLLAASPKSFRHCRDLERTIESTVPFSKSNVGMHIQLPTLRVGRVGLIGLLSCARSVSDESKRRQMLGILLFPLDPPNSGVPNRRMARGAYSLQGMEWVTVMVDVGDIIRSSIEAFIIISNHPQLPHVDGHIKEQDLRKKNEYFVVNMSSTLTAMGYCFTHAKSWLSYDRLRSTLSQNMRREDTGYTFINYNFSTSILFMTFEHPSEIRRKVFTVSLNLHSEQIGVWDISLQSMDDDFSVSYFSPGNQGPELCCYTKGKPVTYYNSNPFNVTAKLLERKVVHQWRIHEIEIGVDTDSAVGLPQSSLDVEMIEPSP